MAAAAVSSALDIGTQIYGLVQQLPQDISTWKLKERILPARLRALKDTLRLVSEQLELFNSALSNAEDTTASQFQHLTASFDIKHYKREAEKISEIIDQLDSRMKHKYNILGPRAPIAATLDELEPEYRTLRESINSLANTIETISKNTINTPVWAPSVSKNYYADLDSENPVKKVLDYILRPDPEPIGAVVVGNGGMGKTIAVRQVARDKRIRVRFTDGVLFTELGEEATKTGVINNIASLMLMVDREDIQQKIQALETIEDAVTQAAAVFRNKRCLIIIDDVWRGAFKSLDIILALSRLSTNEGCKVVFTTRELMYLSDDLTSDVAVHFKKRSAEESERILLKSAGLKKPEVEEDVLIFSKILREADGLPMSLGLAGKSLIQLASSENNTSELSVWIQYGIRSSRPQRLKASMSSVPESVQDGFINLIELIQEQTKNTKYWDYFRALSVVQKAEKMPHRVLCRALGESEPEATKIMESFEKYSIVTVDHDEENHVNRYVVIHDFVLDFARELADENGESSALLMRWLSSFRNPGIPSENAQSNTQGSFKEWWSDIEYDTDSHIYRNVARPSTTLPFFISQVRRDENTQSSNLAGSFKEWWSGVQNDVDNYIYRNVIRILKTATMYGEVLWLINEPWWTQKQIKANGLHQMRSDLDLSVQCVHAWDSLQRRQRELMSKWLKLLRAAITASNDAVSECNSYEMIYTQLFGRLGSYKQSSRVVEDFLKRVKECAPRPFLLPAVGSFPPVPSSFIEKIKYDGQLLVMRQINDFVHIVSYVELEGTEDGFKSSLVLQVNDLVKNSVVKEQILRTEFTFREWPKECYGTINNDGTKIVIGTIEGHVLILEIGSENTCNSNDLIQMTTSRTPKSTVLRGNGNTVTSVAISADGMRIVSESCDNMVRVWDMLNGEWKSDVLRGHKEDVTSVAMSADGKRIVSGSADKTVRVWHTLNGEWKSAVLRDHDYAVWSVVISADGTRIVSGSLNNQVYVWDTHNGEWTSTVLRFHEHLVTSVAMSADGKRIVSGSDDKTVRVWHTHDGEWTSTVLRGHDNWVESVAMSADGTRILCVSFDNTVRVWDTHIGEWTATVLRGHEGTVSSVAMSADRTRIVSGSWDKTVRVWNMHNDEWTSTVLRDHEHYVWSVAMGDSGMCIVSGSWDNTLRVWDTRNGEWTSTVLRGHKGTVSSVAMSADRTCIVSGSWDKTVRVWNMHNGGWTSSVLQGHEHAVSSVAAEISADRRLIVSGSWDKTVRVWDTHNGEWRQTSVLSVGQRVESVKISKNSDIIEAKTKLLNNVWRMLSNGLWEECGEAEGIVLGDSFPTAASSLHAQLTPAHRQALQVLQKDLKMYDSARTANGFVMYGGGAPFIGFIHIVT